MPKILSYTPAWLSRPSPGFDLFSSDAIKLSGESSGLSGKSSVNGAQKKETCTGPHRTIAHVGTEVFVVVGNTIRWTDLSLLKDEWEDQERHAEGVFRSTESPQEEENTPIKGSKYRTLKVPVNEQICQLIPSPNKKLMAILTPHTIHVSILPDSSHLDQPDTGPIRLKTHTLGPTTHVLSQSPVVSAIWHPVGVGGNCLVTITRDAVVRVWELNMENRWSFDGPSLAVDLKKLQHGTTAEEDFSAARIGTNRSFSLDALDMEVVAACFGGTGSEAELGWCSMTLWVAMEEGDVYALCPLLPAKWQPSSSLVPTLTTRVAARKSFLEREGTSPEEQKLYDEQYQWLTEIDQQDPVYIMGEYETSPEVPTYDRPTQPGPIPKLQGPFRILPESSDQDLELSSIHVVAARLDTNDLMELEDDEEDSERLRASGMSSSVVCLLTRGGVVYICLDLDGVEAQWLPSRKLKTKIKSKPISEPELILLEALSTALKHHAPHLGWPTFSPDVHSSYSFYVSHDAGIYFLSLDPWVEKLESELQCSENAGSKFRFDVLTKSSGTLREKLLQIDPTADNLADESVAVPIILQDSDLGYFLLTKRGEQPQALSLDEPNDGVLQDLDQDAQHDYIPDIKMITSGPPRSTYQPPKSLWAKSSLANFIDTRVHNRHRKTLKEEIRLSAATLDIMTEAHRVLSQETHQLGIAAADLFRRCQRLQEEFRDQIRRANDVASQVERLNDEDADDYQDSDHARGSAKIEDRLDKVRKRQEDITARHEVLRRKLIRAGGKDLSGKEQAWVAEIDKLACSVIKPGMGGEADDDDDHKAELWERYEEVRLLVSELTTHAKAASQPYESGGKANGTFQVPPDIRKEKVGQVMGLLERETALVDAAQDRLERLNLSTM